MSLENNLNYLKEKIHEAALKSHRKEKDIQLVAVTKTWSAEKIQPCYELGHRVFGENYVQEFLEKQSHLPSDIRWHFIGNLQSNKVKDVLQKFELIHSIASLSVLKEFEKRLSQIDGAQPQDYLLQVQYLPEPSKPGLPAEEVVAFLEQVKSYKMTRIKGFMWMPPIDLNDRAKHYSNFLYAIDKWKMHLPNGSQANIVSLGTTHDFAEAIQCGATHIRVGSALFGEREKK